MKSQTLILTLLFLFTNIPSFFARPVYLALQTPPIQPLQEALAERSDPLSNKYGQWLSQAEINQLAHPPSEYQTMVLDWLQQYPVTQVENYGDSIHFQADNQTIGQLFHLNPSNTHHPNYHLPDSIRSLVEFVLIPHLPHHRRPTKPKPKTNRISPTADNRYFSLDSLRYLYNVSEDPLSPSVSGGLIEYQSDDGFLSGDLVAQQQLNGQSPNNRTHLVGPNQGIDVESSLDVQVFSQAADQATLWFWDTPDWLYTFAIRFYHTKSVPEVISMSWGWSEANQCDIVQCLNITSADYVARVNREYLKIALRGVTIVVASGDAGAPGRTNELCDSDRPINPTFPASSPYVLTVGATYVTPDQSVRHFPSKMCQNNSCITGRDERSISYEAVGWTAGGGFSLAGNQTPAWQEASVHQYLNSGVNLPNASSFHRQGRAYPDVSAIGHSCPTVLDGKLETVDGTSCSAPVVAGLITVINDALRQQNRSPVGFVNPLLYHLSTVCPNCFQDITHGHNWCTENGCCHPSQTEFGFVATEGYDPVTGIGTLNVGAIIDHLDGGITH